jgi:endonuclease/exonuclease/phosphatase family metal-dependent hydrolase
MAYNLERGIHAGAQIETLRDDPALPRPDLLLLSEADRGCSRSGYRNVARDFARALAMDYVFGVEFLELPRESGGGGRIETVCEHGNAILSRYPLGNVRLLRHARNRSWYLGPRKRAAGGGQPRLGGRMALFADVRVGARLLHAYSVHLESGIRDGEIRRDQARELALDSARLPFPVVIGGDTNAHGYLADLLFGTANDEASRTLLDGRYSDAHRSLPPLERATCPPFLVLDLLFGNGGLFSQPGVCPFSRCGRLSDHLPVWATLNLRTSRVWRKEGT